MTIKLVWSTLQETKKKNLWVTVNINIKRRSLKAQNADELKVNVTATWASLTPQQSQQLNGYSTLCISRWADSFGSKIKLLITEIILLNLIFFLNAIYVHR